MDACPAPACTSRVIISGLACVQVYTHRLRRYIGAYLVHLEGDVDAIVFSAGMGENNALLRGRALQGLQVRGMGLVLMSCPWCRACSLLSPGIDCLPRGANALLQSCTHRKG